VSARGKIPAVRGIIPALLVTACAGMHESPDFERHRYSQIVVPYDHPDLMYFDVATNAQYPAADPAAEATRMEWLAAWLKQRGMCYESFEVVQRRPFEFLEQNPGRYQLRYEVRCKAEPPEPGGADAG
jgi:hypothetical protein